MAQDRVERASLTDFGCGENLFQVTDAKQDAAEYIASEAFTGWLNSPGHYENMIGPIYDTGGVGVFVEPKLAVGDLVPRRYDIYVTHLLCEDISEYNRLKSQYEIAKSLHDALAARYERLKVEYKEIEEQFVKNTVPYSQVEAAFEELEIARAQINEQTERVNDLVDRLSVAAAN